MKSREWRMQGNKTLKLKEKDLDFLSKHAEIFQERKHKKSLGDGILQEICGFSEIR